VQGKAEYDQGKELEANWDYTGARAKFAEAAEKLFAPAQYTLGYYFYWGLGGPEDEAEAARFYQLAADQNNADALNRLGQMYYNGPRGGLPDDDDKGKELLLKAAELGNEDARNEYDFIIRCEEAKRHDAEVVQANIAAADGGDNEARYQVALYYEYGKGDILEQNGEKAVEYLTLAANDGMIQAIVYIAKSYDYGWLGLTEDDAKALEWYRKAADLGDEQSNAKVGEFYEFGYGGVEASIDTAREYYGKGGWSGQYSIDRLDQAAKNRAEVQRLTEAADGGDADAQGKLGELYWYGRLGLPEDEKKAAELYRAAADAGNAMAQVAMGKLYNPNSGWYRDWMEPDQEQTLVESRKYLQMAADQGDEDGASCLSQWFSS
jgi:TPR repeat protein